ncbi:MAG: sporulation protein YabP [Bacilli bacterium]|nr:sporulation protein YabP [Bacilli bacterium]
MDKVKEMENSFNHGISIAERKSVLVTGVKKIDSFDNEEFLMDTTLGYLVIKGSELEIIKLDTYQGNVSIKGNVDSLAYVNKDMKKDKEESFLNKLFK